MRSRRIQTAQQYTVLRNTISIKSSCKNTTKKLLADLVVVLYNRYMIKLQDFNHFRTDPRVKFKTELVDGEEITIVAYMIADSKLWDQPNALETRGIAFNSDGECISRPLTKFFNIGENEQTQTHNLKFYNSVFLEKRDGSMLIPVLINNKIFWKSKKSFYSDVAIKANVCATLEVLNLSRTLLNMGYTPIFEFTHPEHQIVIDYGKEPKFVLIAVRHIESGGYMSIESQEIMCAAHHVECIRRYGDNTFQMLNELDDQVDFEGYVIRHPDGLWTKAKSKWYLLNHRIMTEIRERDIALAVAEECIDDIKSSIAAQGMDIGPVLEIEQRVVAQLETIIEQSELLCTLIKAEPTQKDAAMKYKDNEFFSLAMILYVNKEPKYVDFWKKRFLKVDYSLKVVYNQSFSNEKE